MVRSDARFGEFTSLGGYGLGRFTKIGASLMIMGLVGNALLPMVYGYLVDIFNAREAYWVLFPCYVYLVFYAFRGYRLRKWTS